MLVNDSTAAELILQQADALAGSAAAGAEPAGSLASEGEARGAPAGEGGTEAEGAAVCGPINVLFPPSAEKGEQKRPAWQASGAEAPSGQ